MQKIKKILPVIFGLALLVVPVLAFAQFNYFGNSANFNNSGVVTTETNVSDIAVKVIQWIMGIVGLICVIMIIYGGITYATAAGNEDRITMGKTILIWAIVGLVICLLAFVFANTIVTLFTK